MHLSGENWLFGVCGFGLNLFDFGLFFVALVSRVHLVVVAGERVARFDDGRRCLDLLDGPRIVELVRAVAEVDSAERVIVVSAVAQSVAAVVGHVLCGHEMVNHH